MEDISLLTNFWLNIVIFFVIGIGMVIDVLLIVFFWDKRPNIFKKKLDTAPWSIVDVFKICLGLFFIFAVFNCTSYIILSLNQGIKHELRPILNIVNGIGIYSLGIWYIIHFLKEKYKSNLNSLGIKRPNWLKGSLNGILFYVGYIPLMLLSAYMGVLICALFGIKPEPHPLVEILKKEKSVLFIYYLVIVATFIAPIFEEILFRGLFYQVLKKRVGIFRAAVMSSLFFAFLHFNAAQFLPILGIGLLMCLIFEYTGSLVPVIFVHIFNNGMFLGLFFVIKDNL